MNIYLLRHGIAENLDPSVHSSDEDRKLTAEGLEVMNFEALGMQKLGLQFDVVLASPFIRAQQTAEIVCKHVPNAPAIQISKNITPSGNTTKLIAELYDRYATAKNVLIASHEPFLSESIGRLLADSPRASIHMGKGTLCKLTLEGDHATLCWLMTAEQLLLLSSD